MPAHKSDSISNPQRQQTARSRGERLYPRRSSRLYWHLTQLRKAYESTIACLPANSHEPVIIDYGCGNMPYRPLFEPLAAEYVGVDFTGNEMASASLLPDGGLPLEDGSADIVLSSQVLEHVTDPAYYLAEAHRVLKPSGHLCLSTHGVWRYHPDPTDFWRWTSAGLLRQIALASFEVRHFLGVMGPEASALQLWQDSVLSRVPRRLRRVFTRYMQGRIARADARCSPEMRNRDACVYVLLARPIK